MEAIGMVRIMDDLGRVVIPKEIRRTLRIKNGDPLEMHLTEKGVLLKKYRPQQTAKDFAEEWLEAHKANLDSTEAKFTINNYTVECEVVKTFSDMYLPRRMKGEAICSPKDKFSPAVGMVIAWYRAMGMKVPEELLE